MSMDEYFIIEREVTPGLHVNCFIEFDNNGRQAIGSYSLSEEGVISNIKVTDLEQYQWIVTTSGIDAQLFSKKGSSYYFNTSIE